MKTRNVLLFGCNSLVNDVAKQLLNSQWNITVISQDKECVKRLDTKKITYKYIDYSDDEQLKLLGIGKDVGIVFSFFKEDAKNVYLIVSIKEIDPNILIVTPSQSLDSVEKLRAAGADKVIDPYEYSGLKVFNLIKKPMISETMEHIIYGESAINLAEIKIQPGSFLEGKIIGDSQLLQDYNLIFLGVMDNQQNNKFIFRAIGNEHILNSTNLLVVIGTTEEIERLKNDIASHII